MSDDETVPGAPVAEVMSESVLRIDPHVHTLASDGVDDVELIDHGRSGERP